VGWEPAWSSDVPLLADAAGHTISERVELWRDRLGGDGPEGLVDSDVADQFVLSSDGVERAVVSARLQARLDSSPITYSHLRYGARAQNGAALERLARRIQPGVGWDDLVLTPYTGAALRELAGRARRRHQVLDEWAMRPGGGRGRGITVLFAGDSGTGKTMSAEVVAGDLGLDLYTVNLATVVDKYVGETEKNLERIFVEADGVNAILLFDEADSLFGKRSEVRDANDRYANIEVAYLLQRMETFDGIAILATNLSANVDDAFARRLDMVIDFPNPDVAQRRRLWERSLSPAVPRADDVDLDFCASRFELSGGNIRSIAVSAAYRAAESGQPVTMSDLVRAIGQEYRKLGRLVVANEFGHYLEHAGEH
jgi:SpoVK/Ycf46/Vps4 family AAA+-type ATPase